MLLRNLLCPQCLLYKSKPDTKINFLSLSCSAEHSWSHPHRGILFLAPVSPPTPLAAHFPSPAETSWPLPPTPSMWPCCRALSTHQRPWPPQAAMALNVARYHGRPWADLRAGPLSGTPHHPQRVSPSTFTLSLSEPQLVIFSPNSILLSPTAHCPDQEPRSHSLVLTFPHTPHPNVSKSNQLSLQKCTLV